MFDKRILHTYVLSNPAVLRVHWLYGEIRIALDVVVFVLHSEEMLSALIPYT